MSAIGNIIWVIFAGLWLAIGWAITGLLWCATIIGIPVGLQCFKFAGLALAPFGRDGFGGAGSLLLNILWLIFGGLELRAGFGSVRTGAVRYDSGHTVWTAML